MKPSNPTLTALLASRQFFAADLFYIVLVDGTELRYCGGDKDIIYGGHTWPCGGFVGPYFQKRGGNRGLCQWKIGVEVSTLQFDVLPGTAKIQGFDFLTACRIGIFDGAECTLYRAFMPTYGDTSAGIVNLFSGRIVEIDCGRSMATFNVNSHLELLSQQWPRDLYQPSCLNTLFDSGCTLNRASFAVTAAVTAGSTVSTIKATLAQATGYFNSGTIVFTSGANSGFKRSIKTFTSGGSVALLVPLPFLPAVSDTFTIYPGCNRTLSTCGSFGNTANFRGHPDVPSPETGI
jgi:uncharacterized phage protein (TIGR02218 family)